MGEIAVGGFLIPESDSAQRPFTPLCPKIEPNTSTAGLRLLKRSSVHVVSGIQPDCSHFGLNAKHLNYLN